MKEGSGCLSWIISKYLEYLQYLKYLGYLEEVKCGECFAMVDIVTKKALVACPGNQQDIDIEIQYCEIF